MYSFQTGRENSMSINHVLMITIMLTAALAGNSLAICTGGFWAADTNEDCYVDIRDYSLVAEDWFKTDSSQQSPVPSGPDIIVEAEDCLLQGFELEPATGQPDAADILVTDIEGITGVQITGGGGVTNLAQGRGRMTVPVAIPDGTYIITLKYFTGLVNDISQYAVMWGASTGSVTQSNSWSTFYPRDTLGAASSTWYDAELTPSGFPFLVSPGSPLPEYHILNDIAVNDFYIEIWDQTQSRNYDYAFIDKIIFTPVLVPGNPIHIEAEDCTLTGLGPGAWPDGQGGYIIDQPISYFWLYEPGGKVYLASDPSGHNVQFGSGVTEFRFPDDVSIPDGDYILTMTYELGTWVPGGGQAAFQIGLDPNSIGSVYENGITGQNAWHIFYPNMQGGGTYTDQLAGSEGIQWAVWDQSPLAQSLTVSNVSNGEMFVRINDDNLGGNYAYLGIDYFELIPYIPLKGDLDSDGDSDINDVSVFAQQWLFCNNPLDQNCDDIPTCPEQPVIGITEYTASSAQAVTIDGDLSDWPAFDYDPNDWCKTNWIAVDKLYAGDPIAENAYLCLMYSETENVIYGAVTVEDWTPLYQYYAGWDQQDSLEIYIQGNLNNMSPTDPSGAYANAQHYVLGLESDGVNSWKIWGDGVAFGAHSGETGAPNVTVAITRVPNIQGFDRVTYEFKITPYDNYGGINGSATAPTELSSGKQLGFDIVLGDRSAGLGFGNLCPNLLTGKFADIRKYATLTCQ